MKFDTKKIITYCSLFVYSLFVYPFIFQKLWAWFIHNYYGEYRVSYSEAFVVYTFLRFVVLLLNNMPKDKTDPEKEASMQAYAISVFLKPWLILLFAAFSKLFLIFFK